MGGKRCVTENEGYIIKAGISQPVCTWHCLRNESCDVINYKTNGICLLSSGPCIVAENEDQSIATVFSVNRPCLEWVAFSESERDNSVRVESPINIGVYLSVIRFLADNDKLPGAFSSSINKVYLIHNGVDKSCSPASDCEALVVNPGCTVDWVDYKPETQMPLHPGAVPGGSLDGKTLYIAAYFDHIISLGLDICSIGYIDSSSNTATIPFSVSITGTTEMMIPVWRG